MSLIHLGYLKKINTDAANTQHLLTWAYHSGDFTSSIRLGYGSVKLNTYSYPYFPKCYFLISIHKLYLNTDRNGNTFITTKKKLKRFQNKSVPEVLQNNINNHVSDRQKLDGKKKLDREKKVIKVQQICGMVEGVKGRYGQDFFVCFKTGQTIRSIIFQVSNYVT